MWKRKIKTRQKVLAIAFSIVLIIVLINVYLLNFEKNLQKEERNNAVDSLAGVANQGAAIVETKINLSMSILRNLAEMLERTEEIQQQENLDYLNQVLEDENLDMIRLGIATPDGTAITTTGNVLNVSDRDYFQECMKGNEIVTGSVKSRIFDAEIIFLAVPISDETDGIKGVLYGVIECGSFQMYDNTEMGGDESEMYIIDGEGNYVANYKELPKDGNEKNFFKEIEPLEKSVSMEAIQEQLTSRSPIYLKVKRGSDCEYIYITPIDINKWCAVTIVKEETIQRKVHSVSDSVSLLTARVVTTLALFVLLFYYMIWSEKKKAEDMNRELRIRDNIFKVAVSELESQVFLYDAKKDEMRFLSSDSYEKLLLPQTIHNVSEEMLKYFSKKNQKVMRPAIMAMFDDLKNGREESKHRIVLTRNEQTFYYGIKIIHFYDASGEPLQSIGMIYDISENYEKELMLKREEKMRRLFMADAIGVYEVNVTRNLMIGESVKVYGPDASYTEVLEDFVEKRVAEEFKEKLLEQWSIYHLKSCFLAGQNNMCHEYKYIQDDGTTCWASCEIHLERDAQSGNLIAFITTRDIDTKKRRELYLEERAVFDPLTKVYNRSAGRQYINKALEEMEPGETSAFILCDLDHFKQLNDTLGHIRGDRALKDVADILKNHFRMYDIVCRLGGDEFVVFVQRIPSEVLDRVITSLLKKMELEYERDDIRVSITISAGVAIAPEHGTSFEELYEKADRALYQVKQTTRNSYKIYRE